jgi:hypothetical protein
MLAGLRRRRRRRPPNGRPPKRDHARGHVVPTLVRKFVEGADRDAPEVEVWGDGSATREFPHVRVAGLDLARREAAARRVP